MKSNQPQRILKPRTDVAVGQSTIKDSLKRSKKYDRKSKKWKEITDDITYLICKDSLPIYTVEKPGFKRLITSLDSRYEIPSPSYFSKTAIPTLYASTIDKVKEELSSVNFFAGTTDYSPVMGWSLTLATKLTLLIVLGNSEVDAYKHNSYLKIIQEKT